MRLTLLSIKTDEQCRRQPNVCRHVLCRSKPRSELSSCKLGPARIELIGSTVIHSSSTPLVRSSLKPARGLRPRLSMLILVCDRVRGSADDRYRHVGRDEEESARHNPTSIRCIPRCLCLRERHTREKGSGDVNSLIRSKGSFTKHYYI
jgi:hypothetical protein